MDWQRTILRTKARLGETSAPNQDVQHMGVAAQKATGVCPKCGMMNEPEAFFCCDCGAKLRENNCPICNAPMESGTDYCEACHNYVINDMCSFCSAPLSNDAVCCPECGQPRQGIHCSVCGTLSRFSFCPNCGNALTDQAREQLKKSWDVPFLNEVRGLEKELENLWMKAPVNSASQRQRREANVDIRNSVLALLENDGEVLYERLREMEPLMSEEKLADLKEQKRRKLQELLDRMAMPEQPTPAQARLISMACKPSVSRLAWRCNFKGALHTSPLGCACPQKGGKWIVLKPGEKVENDQ